MPPKRDPTRAAHWANRTAAYHGVVTWSPTIDPERLKLLSQEAINALGAIPQGKETKAVNDKIQARLKKARITL